VKVDADYFPEEGLLPLSLTSLAISDCPNLKKLDYKGLQGILEEDLPKLISHFSIRGNCPLLKGLPERRRRLGKEDWEKIAHIQHLNIY